MPSGSGNGSSGIQNCHQHLAVSLWRCWPASTLNRWAISVPPKWLLNIIIVKMWNLKYPEFRYGPLFVFELAGPFPEPFWIGLCALEWPKSAQLHLVNVKNLHKTFQKRLPDLYFAHARTSRFHDVIAPNFNLFIDQNGTIAYSTRSNNYKLTKIAFLGSPWMLPAI